MSGWTTDAPINLKKGASYQLYARARNLPFESEPAQLGVQVQQFDAAGSLLTMPGVTPALEGVQLSERATELKATFQAHPAAATAKVAFTNSAGAGTLVLESAVMGQLD